MLTLSLVSDKFNVSYSTIYYKLIDDDNIDALYPDKIMEETIDDFKKLLIDIIKTN